MHAALISVICPFFIQSMLSRSFNSNYAPVSSFHYGSSRDLHGSQGNVTLSVADGRSSGVHMGRVSTCIKGLLLVRKRACETTLKLSTSVALCSFILWLASTRCKMMIQ